jgi:hypothetical protein
MQIMAGQNRMCSRMAIPVDMEPPKVKPNSAKPINIEVALIPIRTSESSIFSFIESFLCLPKIQNVNPDPLWNQTSPSKRALSK